MELAAAPASGTYRNHRVLSDNLKCQYAPCSKSSWNLSIFPSSIHVSYQCWQKKVTAISGERNLQKSVLAKSPWSFSTSLTSNQVRDEHLGQIYLFSQNCKSGRIRFPPSKCSGKDSVAQDEEVDNIGVRAAISTLKFYKREISPLLPKSCRYIPTCSEYSMIAYRKYGFVKGTILTAWRICRCNPLGGSGFDPPRWFNESSLPEQ